ncbi:Uncharacterised protein [Acinetobacter phage MD-2021a]|nr:Uncharacterised protein [Acinetobacter phage MD-2021a]CAH1088981.1 Uncharacterised protein [Acinetobacter phage MD-2021a]
MYKCRFEVQDYSATLHFQKEYLELYNRVFKNKE